MKKVDHSNVTNNKIAVIGLGYVGLPLLCLFSTLYQCWGLDRNKGRVCSLRNGIDPQGCEKRRNITYAIKIKNSQLTSSWNDVSECNFYIVAVPTPIDKNNQPNLSALKDVCVNIGKVLKPNDIVVFESTVYPGATEDICIPLLETYSHYKVNKDFYVGYSPERINVGDKKHKLINTPKIVSASSEVALNIIRQVYGSVIDSEIVVAASIKIAEASKMYENVQRDVLIALANQYADYCRIEGINIHDVIACASSKWNVVDVHPGLVGGHCIGVDPYYLLQRAKEKNMVLSIISSAREENEKQPSIIANQIMKQASSLGDISKLKALVLGFAYKANTSDIRNTKIANVIQSLQNHFFKVDCFDPLVDAKTALSEYGVVVKTTKSSLESNYDVVIKLVNHTIFQENEYSGNIKLRLEDLQ